MTLLRPRGQHNINHGAAQNIPTMILIIPDAFDPMNPVL